MGGQLRRFKCVVCLADAAAEDMPRPAEQQGMCCVCSLHAAVQLGTSQCSRPCQPAPLMLQPPNPPPNPTLAQVLDHHKTAAAELTDPSLARSCPSLEVVFDMERSGATIRCAGSRSARAAHAAR